jgi:UDP-4-amino-4,6-dideoxy-N-acetyl-beta-L-altrosamine transaminase
MVNQMLKSIPYARQSISKSDIAAVVQVLSSDFLTQGPVVPAFEAAVANYCHAKHAVATSNATSALHLACLALGLGQGDILWTSPITFVASANCALYCGASVDFVDIDPKTYNLCPLALEEKLLLAQKTARLPTVVVAVHLCGQPCDMQAIHALSVKYGFKVIEDASHAIGAKYKGEPVGAGRYSDITIFSFHPVKIITSCEGGMALTNNTQWAKTMMRLRSHGISSDPAEMQVQTDHEIWNYQQLELGFNYRMSELHGALGFSQFQQLDEFLNSRRKLAQKYDEFLKDFPLVTPWQHPDSVSSYHLYPIRICSSEMGLTQRQFYEALHLANIKVNLHYIPVYLQPFYAQKGFKRGYCKNAEAYFQEAISIPMYAGMTDVQLKKVYTEIRHVFEQIAISA